MRRLILVATCAALLGVPAGAVTLELVPVVDPNAADETGLGAVADPYRIGKYEVSNAQYAEFLDAVARTDAHGLYNAKMDPITGDPRGGIQRTGSPGSYAYAATGGRENKPVVFVSWYDALRFANWLHNGQPTPGIQNDDTTENGAYTFTGTTSVGPRNPGALFFLPTEDEWYKAAYYDPASMSYGYFPFVNGLNGASCEAGPGTTDHSANCNLAVGDLSDAGTYTASPSAYGTYDQGGNVWEWNETAVGSGRRLRGGSWDISANNLAKTFPTAIDPTNEKKRIGFRLASAAPACADGTDNDGDGGVDFDPLTLDDPLDGTGDPSCWSPFAPIESGPCQNGRDDDGDGLIDFDGGASLDLDGDGFVDASFNPGQPAITGPDPGCLGLPWKIAERLACGLGFELALLLPPLRWMRRRRGAASGGAPSREGP